jgi:predicted transcriptional regulator
MDLGKLEREVMEFVWAAPSTVSVRDFYQHAAGRMAYTTAMTTLDRLYKKGLLDREKHGKAFLYRARNNREEYERSFAKRTLERLLPTRLANDDARPLLASLVEAVTERDLELLDELEKMVKAAKQRNRKA